MFRLCNIRKYDGFLIQGNQAWPPELRQKFVDDAVALNKPVVSINYELKGAHYVGTNNYEAMYGLVRKVIADRKCTKPLFVNGLESSIEAQDRARAYRDVCAKMNVPDPRFHQASWEIEEGKATARMLMRNLDDLPDVAFCCNDDLAVGLQETLQAHGVRVPKETL